MIILQKQQIEQKIKRIAMEIVERNAKEKQLMIAGINQKGYQLGELLKKEILKLGILDCELIHIQLNPADPLNNPVNLSVEPKTLKNKCILITDDVSNSGRTIFFAFKPLMECLPKKIEVAVLIERMHKSFPVQVNYYGLKLATTTKENIEVQMEEKSEWKVELN